MPREFSRTLRINAQLQRELSSLIREQLTDPRVALVSVTRVDVSPDLRNARISISLLGSDAELKAAVKALNGAASLLRHRHGQAPAQACAMVPMLRFVADEALREGDRIGSLIRDATTRDLAHPVAPSAAVPPKPKPAPTPDDGEGSVYESRRRSVDGILLLDKPLGLSSNAALQIVKRLYNAEKAGHTGSLDPLASGLLPICLGEATKLGAYLLDADKRYRARVRLGTATASGDAEGAVVATSDPAALSRGQLEAAIPRFLGAITQIPPMYSAIKREGRPLYTLARAGIEVERAAREVSIHELKLLSFGDGEFEFELRCSKGTYVRTLAEDWAAAVNQRAHLSALRRTGVGGFDAGAMVPLEWLQQALAPAARATPAAAPGRRPGRLAATGGG